MNINNRKRSDISCGKSTHSSSVTRKGRQLRAVGKKRSICLHVNSVLLKILPLYTQAAFPWHASLLQCCRKHIRIEAAYGGDGGWGGGGVGVGMGMGTTTGSQSTLCVPVLVKLW